MSKDKKNEPELTWMEGIETELENTPLPRIPIEEIAIKLPGIIGQKLTDQMNLDLDIAALKTAQSKIERGLMWDVNKDEALKNEQMRKNAFYDLREENEKWMEINELVRFKETERKTMKVGIETRYQLLKSARALARRQVEVEE